MKLASNWKQILEDAWSIRLLLIAGALSGVEALFPSLVAYLPSLSFQILQSVIIAAAFIARLLAQTEFPDAPEA